MGWESRTEKLGLVVRWRKEESGLVWEMVWKNRMEKLGLIVKWRKSLVEYEDGLEEKNGEVYVRYRNEFRYVGLNEAVEIIRL